MSLRILRVIAAHNDLEGRMVKFFNQDLPDYGFTDHGLEERLELLDTLPPWAALVNFSGVKICL